MKENRSSRNSFLFGSSDNSYSWNEQTQQYYLRLAKWGRVIHCMRKMCTGPTVLDTAYCWNMVLWPHFHGPWTQPTTAGTWYSGPTPMHHGHSLPLLELSALAPLPCILDTAYHCWNLCSGPTSISCIMDTAYCWNMVLWPHFHAKCMLDTDHHC